LSAELLSGATARDLVPGDPDALDRLAARLDVLARGMSDAARKLGDVEAAGWSGPAADAFSALVGEQPKKYRTAGSAFEEAVSALHAYTRVLREAQADAGRARTLAGTAQDESDRWRSARTAYDADSRTASANGDSPPDGPVPPASDPSAADRYASQQLLSDARERVRTQGQAMAAALNAAADAAPDKPGLFHSIIHGAGEFFGGVWEGIKGLGDIVVLLAKLSPIRRMVDPVGWARDASDLAKGLWWGITHPVEFAKAIVDWDTWKSNPLRAFGRLIPDIALAFATAGAGTAATGATRGSRALRVLRGGDHRPDPERWPPGHAPGDGKPGHGAPPVLDVAATRVKLRAETKRQIHAAAEAAGLRTPDGDFIDPNTGQVIPKEGPLDYGHKPGYEWRTTQERARAEGWTREQLIEYENDPSHYQIEDPGANRSHRYEAPR
jgi:hypothetical protein